MTKMAAMPIYGTHFKIVFLGTSGQISMKLSICEAAHLYFCSNDNPGLILSYFTARSNFATKAFILENVTMRDSLEIISSCDLEFSFFSNLMNK